ncbi:zinc-dependent alcohol dehydrogenase family protein [Gordonia sputi]
MPRAVEFDQFGGPEVLHHVHTPVPEPAGDEVRVRIEAFAVNPLDAMMRSGSSPAPVPLPHVRLGIEGTGVIDATGREVSGFRVGDPVIITAIPNSIVRGSYADFTTIPASWVVARPAELDVVEAAAIWVGYSTAYGALVEAANIQPNDRVLIAGASGSVGRAAIQVASRLCAVPIAITRDVTKTDDLLEAGAAAVVATDRENVPAAVQRLTDGTGADITLDVVRGPGQQALLKATRPGGRLIAVGFLDPRPTPEPDDVSVTIVNYRGFDYLLDPAVTGRMSAFLDAGVQQGGFRPVIDTVFGLDDIVEAHRRFDAAGQHGGKKIVVTT